MLRRTRAILIAILTSPTILLLLYNRNLDPPFQHQVSAPANSTLGFGTILAVSRPHSRRQPGLLWAANLTDLEIVIPHQPEWTEAELDAFRLTSDSAISEGSARAWLGHLNALRCFLDTGKETALIIEDDVDFDLSIRSHQIPLLAPVVRSLLSNTSSARSSVDERYWGDTNTWDILYPGHCDDALPSPPGDSSGNPTNPLLSHPHLFYPDPSIPPHTLLHPDTSNFLRALRVPESTRILHRTFAPFCTFAYAVNRRSAERIVKEFSREREGVEAFDVQLLKACGEGLRCFSVGPEIFHHADGGSEIASVDRGVEGGVELVRDIEALRKGTWNLRCGARHGQLWVDEDDEDGRARAKEVVMRMLERGAGECPIDLVKAERSWKGCEWGECGAQS
ncbi:glycosyltransferase family 25 protein [Macroventuria anomochaeta]|uniref:Glycosyltransferase family 25 protein n=1 Tax=Macroventuria anomochaeta TaxID=301207 RepID=A0ACB6RY13_9PLEO|nr:glycosyltransferase family 25 protein [Macroventuria anomochaeta]KAF2626597.1 glycosyltransferase family 25 protein [Macroventuria anomochaeta]